MGLESEGTTLPHVRCWAALRQGLEEAVCAGGGSGDEDANALTPDGAALQLEGDGLWSLAAAPGPGYGAPMKLLAGRCGDGTITQGAVLRRRRRAATAG